MLIIVAIIDAVSESVSIPAAAWAWIAVLWLLIQVCIESTKKAKKSSAVVAQTHEMDWLISPDKEGIYSSVDGNWQIVNFEDGKWMLVGEADQFVILSATKLAAAMDQAEIVISALTPKE